MEYILHADDDATDRSDLERLLNVVMPSAKLTGCSNGLELMQCLGNLRDDELPCLIFLDIRMPIWDGIRTLNALKSDGRYSFIPVLMWSITDTMNEINLCLRSGAMEFITKPTTDAEWKEMKIKMDKLVKDVQQVYC